MAEIIAFPEPGSVEAETRRQRCQPGASFIEIHQSAFALVKLLGHETVVDALLDLALDIEMQSRR